MTPDVSNLTTVETRERPEVVPLPGEGEAEVTVRIRCRKVCEVCVEPATHLLTFVRKGFRSKPFNEDEPNLRWITDHETAVCDLCKEDVSLDPPKGMVLNFEFPATVYPQRLLYWQIVPPGSIAGLAAIKKFIGESP